MSVTAGVLGLPVAHSLSPLLHRAAYAELGLDWRYEAVECAADELPAVLSARPDWAGFSCTMPLKHAALDVAAVVRPLAGAAGAANTLLPGPDGWEADNTDVAGVLAALSEHAVAPATVTVLGAGGTAQAVITALVALGVESVNVLVRDVSRAAAAIGTAARVGVSTRVGVLQPDAVELAADLVVSTLPAGAATPFTGFDWQPGQTVFDVSYDPWPSALAAAAAAAGARTVNGAELLLHQAAVQVALMTGEDPPVDAMRAALAARLPDAGLLA